MWVSVPSAYETYNTDFMSKLMYVPDDDNAPGGSILFCDKSGNSYLLYHYHNLAAAKRAFTCLMTAIEKGKHHYILVDG